MQGAIFYSSRYGSTARYAGWIAEETGLPVFDVDTDAADPAGFDFLVLGSPIIYHALDFHRWVGRHEAAILARPTILFSVSGAGAGAKLDGWIADSLSDRVIAHVTHIALGGRQDPKTLSWYDRTMLIIGGLKNRDRVAAREEIKGFDKMDRSGIAPIVAQVGRWQSEEAAAEA